MISRTLSGKASVIRALLLLNLAAYLRCIKEKEVARPLPSTGKARHGF
jgi:hypothetical protein